MAASSPIQNEYAELSAGVEATPDPAESKRVAYIGSQIQLAEQARAPLVQQTWEAIAMITQRQWATWDDRNRRMRDEDASKRPKWKKRITLDYTSGSVDVAVSKLTNNQPSWLVRPATSEEVDIESAKLCERLLDHVWDECGMGAETVEWMRWAVPVGIGWMHVTWDTEAGQDYEIEAEPESTPWELEEPGDAPEGSEQDYREDARESAAEGEPPEPREPRMRRVKTGFPSIQAVSPLSILRDPGACRRDLKDCRWIAHQALMHIDEIRERWPERGMFVQPDAAATFDGYTPYLDVRRDGSMAATSIDRARVITYYEKSGPRHPNGYYAVTAGGWLLEERAALPCGGMLPFFAVRFNAIAGRLEGEGMVRRIAQPQRMINYNESKRAEQVNLHGNQKWSAVEGSIAQKTMTNAPAEVIFHKPGMPAPRPIPPPPISPQFQQISGESINHLIAISGVSEVSRGNVSEALSGRAAGIMAEADATKWQVTVREMELCFQGIGRMVLELWREYAPPGYTLQIAGDDNAAEAVAFDSGAIRSTDVRIAMGSMTIKHPTIQNEQILQTAERGVFGNLADPAVQKDVQRRMALPGVIRDDEAGNGETSYAREVNHALLRGEDVPVHPWEDHAEHIRLLRGLLTSSVIREYPPAVFDLAVRKLAEREYWESQKAQGVPWFTSYLPPHLQAPPAPQSMPSAPPAAPPGMPQPPPFDAFGLPPEAMIPRPPPPIPTSDAGLPVEPLGGQGVEGMDAAGALLPPGM